MCTGDNSTASTGTGTISSAGSPAGAAVGAVLGVLAAVTIVMAIVVAIFVLWRKNSVRSSTIANPTYQGMYTIRYCWFIDK